MKTTFLMTVTVVLSGRTAPLPPRTLVCHPQRGMGVGKVGTKGCAEIIGMKIIGLFVQCLQITE